MDPDTVEVLMTFEPDPADLALSSIPGHETFDPRRHRFSEEELKPQPIMKKARKIQVPEEQKVRVMRDIGLGVAVWHTGPKAQLCPSLLAHPGLCPRYHGQGVLACRQGCGLEAEAWA